MNKESIGKIRSMPGFIEKSDGLVDEAERNGDTEWEYDLYAEPSHAGPDMSECVSRLFGDEREEVASDPGGRSILTTKSGISLYNPKELSIFAAPRRRMCEG